MCSTLVEFKTFQKELDTKICYTQCSRLSSIYFEATVLILVWLVFLGLYLIVKQKVNIQALTLEDVGRFFVHLQTPRTPSLLLPSRQWYINFW